MRRQIILAAFTLGFAGAVAMGPAGAQEVPVEAAALEGSAIVLTLHPFLTEEELRTLRLVMTNADALKIFVPDAAKGFAALALSPDEGFIRAGAPVPSAIAIAGMATAEEAATAALTQCDAARAAEAAGCVVTLTVAPAP